MNHNFISCKQKLLCYYIIPVLCFLDFLYGFYISVATLKYPPALPPKKKQPLKHFSKHLVSDGQIVLVLKHKCTFI